MAGRVGFSRPTKQENSEEAGVKESIVLEKSLHLTLRISKLLSYLHLDDEVLPKLLIASTKTVKNNE